MTQWSAEPSGESYGGVQQGLSGTSYTDDVCTCASYDPWRICLSEVQRGQEAYRCCCDYHRYACGGGWGYEGGGGGTGCCFCCDVVSWYLLRSIASASTSYAITARMTAGHSAVSQTKIRAALIYEYLGSGHTRLLAHDEKRLTRLHVWTPMSIRVERVPLKMSLNVISIPDHISQWLMAVFPRQFSSTSHQ